MVYVNSIQILQRSVTFNIHLLAIAMERKRRYFLSNLGVNNWSLKELGQIKPLDMTGNIAIEPEIYNCLTSNDITYYGNQNEYAGVPLIEVKIMGWFRSIILHLS